MTESGELLRTIITQHGGIVMLKLAQWLCHREDIITDDLRKTLLPLQDKVPSTSLTTTKYVENPDELGRLIGSGSVSFVFESLKHDSCIVKIYRDKAKQIEEIKKWRIFCDIINTTFAFTNFANIMSTTLLNNIANFNYGDMDRIFHVECGKVLSKEVNFSTIDLKGFLSIILKQLSYSNELYNFRCIEPYLIDLEFVVTPDIMKLDNDTLVMSHINGLSSNYIEENHPEYYLDMRAKMLITYLWMVYNSVIHTDLHGGNCLYIIDPDDDARNKLAVLDYGMCVLPSDTRYWDLWKAYAHHDTSQIYELLSKMIVSKNTNNVYKVDLYNKKLNNNFCEWIDDILCQIKNLNMVISAESSNVLLGFVLLGRNKLCDKEIDIFSLCVNKMMMSRNNKIAEFGSELQADINSLESVGLSHFP